MQPVRALPSPRPSPLLLRAAHLPKARRHLIWKFSGRFSNQPIYTEPSRLETQTSRMKQPQHQGIIMIYRWSQDFLTRMELF